MISHDGRYQLSLYISDDEGSTWKWKELIEYQADKKGSFSYPCLIQTNDGLLNISYSYSLGEGKKTIKHVVVDPAIICAQQPVQAGKTWSEKLGFPHGQKVLLLHMDDAGMCPEANGAVKRYITNGEPDVGCSDDALSGGCIIDRMGKKLSKSRYRSSP